MGTVAIAILAVAVAAVHVDLPVLLAVENLLTCGVLLELHIYGVVPEEARLVGQARVSNPNDLILALQAAGPSREELLLVRILQHLHCLLLKNPITIIYNIIQNNNNTTNIVEDNSKKKKVVSFDLNKNTIYEISNEFNEDPKHIKNVYGEKVLNNNSKYSINNIKYSKSLTNPKGSSKPMQPTRPRSVEARKVVGSPPEVHCAN